MESAAKIINFFIILSNCIWLSDGRASGNGLRGRGRHECSHIRCALAGICCTPTRKTANRFRETCPSSRNGGKKEKPGISPSFSEVRQKGLRSFRADYRMLISPVQSKVKCLGSSCWSVKSNWMFHVPSSFFVRLMLPPAAAAPKVTSPLSSFLNIVGQ